jgi:hypothetical protein
VPNRSPGSSLIRLCSLRFRLDSGHLWAAGTDRRGLAAALVSSAACAHAAVMSVLSPAEVLIAARRLAGARPHLVAVAGIVHQEEL